MLHVAGGAYFEHCYEPEGNSFFGSGLRAALAVSSLTPVQLHTYVDSNTSLHLAVHAKPFRIKYHEHPCERVPSFHYTHPLATPVVQPIGQIQQADPMRVEGEAVLCFGMLEGVAGVRARRAVYDPQSPMAPKTFDQTGSLAEELALVLNAREARLLARDQSRSLDATAALLQKVAGASLVVIKNGARGAVVFSEGRKYWVPAYRTERVWKIGSGDVFAAAFAHFWAGEKLSAREAAEYASVATATYCAGNIIPLPKTFLRDAKRKLEPIRIRNPYLPPKRQARVYLAGPFFTMAQRWLINEARFALSSQGLQVFSPLHEVGVGPPEVVAPADLAALDECDVVFAIVDGTDAGTIFEVGYAKARGIPTIAFAQNESSETLTMLTGSECDICNDFTTAIYRTAWAVAQ